MMEPKTGVGRFSTEPGTYHSPPLELGCAAEVSVAITGLKEDVSAMVGENLLRVLERAGGVPPTLDFCYEGTCRLCECEVQGGLKELAIRSDAEEGDVVRACMACIPGGRARIEVDPVEAVLSADEMTMSSEDDDDGVDDDFFV
eukprot:CAMPEP_0114234210 /NCGR_PEP_ID=MMETSP0058-20121206/5591_1 /TAXON_ID=36894 /ORGANISM="Pyramimonas parkeae, CCMP726" /LENGTH=143 /DNA_ID=CAMNT_0001345881 /DNA_START=372 /DNA_END=803 /DNA_ORIENTATION=+